MTALDLLWPIFLLAGIERARIVPGATAFTPLVFDSYPWSHSLLLACIWGAVFAGFAYRLGVPRSHFYLLAGLVVSHWVLDFISHAPDMPLWPGPSPKLGLGLWYSIPATLVLEGALWIVGIVVYLRGVQLGSRGARFAFWSFIVVTTAMWAASPWSPPPPSVETLGWFSLIGWIVIPWVVLADRGSRDRWGRE
ncbi:MAG TPA: hypothetical protein VFM14_16025 [Gemmatimonadales bacterium]|nr:hypothetical protein [Gemmatimonadales bacterium]